MLGFRLAVTDRARAGAARVAFLRRHLRAARALVKTSVTELSVALVGDAESGQVHERFLGLAGPTDVLTFELDHDAHNRVTAGEVVVCVPEARRRCRERGTPVDHELLLYGLHGLLHLSGFDDRTAAGYRRMHQMEDRILTQLGLGRVFADGDGDAPTPASPLARPRRQATGRPRRGGGR